MAEAAVRCLHCQSEAVVRYGRASNGKEQLRDQQRESCGWTFLRLYAYPGCVPPVKRQIVEMTLKGGVRENCRSIRAQSLVRLDYTLIRVNDKRGGGDTRRRTRRGFRAVIHRSPHVSQFHARS